MKYPIYIIVAITTTLSIGCNREKSEIEKAKDASVEAIEAEQQVVNTAAHDATTQTQLDARIDLAEIEAERVSTNARLEAEKERVEAETEAAKQRRDAETR